jgi:hypothetical protein
VAKNPLQEFTMPFKKGDVIFLEGEPGADMYIVQGGTVEIYRVLDGADEVLALMEKGDFFGEMSLLEGTPRSASARVGEDAELIIINGTTFDKMLKANIEIAVRMLRKMSIRVRAANRQVEELRGKLIGQSTVERRSLDIPAKTPPVVAPPPPAAELLAEFINPESGKHYRITSDDVVVGRFDPVTATSPEVDLTAEDPMRSVSRRHAKLITSGGKFYISEEVGTLNGTFVNGKRIPTGILTAIEDGNSIDFAMVKLKFKCPPAGK